MRFKNHAKSHENAQQYQRNQTGSRYCTFRGEKKSKAATMVLREKMCKRNVQSEIKSNVILSHVS